MPLFKKKITEQEAAAHFVLSVMERTRDMWPNIYDDLRNSYGDRVTIGDQTMAAFDLALAVLSQEIQALRNLFPKDQSERLRKWVLACIDSTEYGEYAKNEVKEYDESFQQSLKNAENPLDAISIRLLHRWLGRNVKNFEIRIGSEKTGIIDPLLVMRVRGILVTFTRTWETIKENFKLLQGDLPLVYDTHGLKDYKPEQEEQKPEITDGGRRLRT